jgi:radical SAM protein (TIGR04043 family)
VIPGKAEVPVARYFEAFAAAVAVFGRGQVSSYLIAGLGDDPATLVDTARRMLELGVYPFVVPFVPIAGTPLADRPPPDAATMLAIYQQVGRLTAAHGVRGADMKAGCGKCGACSTVGAHEACA